MSKNGNWNSSNLFKRSSSNENLAKRNFFPAVQYKSNFDEEKRTNLRTKDDTVVILPSKKNIVSSPFQSAASALAVCEKNKNYSSAARRKIPDEEISLKQIVTEENLNPEIYRSLKSLVSLFPGETLLKFQSAIQNFSSNRENFTNGDLFITNYRIIFRERSPKSGKTFFDFPLNSIGQINKVGRQLRSSFRDRSNYGLEILCKDFREFFFGISRENHQRRDLFEFLVSLVFPFSIEKIDLNLNENFFKKFFCSSFKKKFCPNEIDIGWTIYDRISDYRRMGLNEFPDFFWRIDTERNENFQICDSYPSVLVVPSNFAAEKLENVAAFRSRNRFPVLSWFSKETLASITRSSQPLTGLTRSDPSDIDYLQEISKSSVKSEKRLFIIDARPKVNAIANQATGGGYESYFKCDLEFAKIENIHVVRESFNKLFLPIVKKQPVQEADQSSWISHLRAILTSVLQIVELVHIQCRCVLVHCSDGWDRTAQLTSLSMLLLDGYYRTFDGFLVLIEKEWISFGHKFLLRLGHGDKQNSEQSPIFIQFLDCTFQLMEKFRDKFEFNENLLLTIADALYTCQYGTFLLNTDKQRAELKICQHTVSLWTIVIDQRSKFINSNYDEKSKRQVLSEPISSFKLKLWKNYFLHLEKDHIKNNSDVTAKRQLLMKSLRERLADLSNDETDSLPMTPRPLALTLSGSLEKNQTKNPLSPSTTNR